MIPEEEWILTPSTIAIVGMSHLVREDGSARRRRALPSLADHQLVDVGLSFAIATQGIRPNIDFVTRVVDPGDRMTVLVEPNFLEIRRLLQPGEYLPFAISGRRSTTPS